MRWMLDAGGSEVKDSSEEQEVLVSQDQSGCRSSDQELSPSELEEMVVVVVQVLQGSLLVREKTLVYFFSELMSVTRNLVHEPN